MHRVLALDLGTKTGWAYGCLGDKSPASYGTVTWATAKEIKQQGQLRGDRICDLRFPRFCAWLETFKTDIIIWEDVEFSTTTYQTQLWSMFRSAIWCSVDGLNPKPRLECVPVGTLKKFATGHGNATKDLMRSAIIQCDGPHVYDKVDDNAIDAIWLWKWAEKHLSKAVLK